jgi:hypothetical protein
MSTQAKRRIAAASVVMGFVALAIETAIRAPGFAPYVAPFLVVVCGLDYLRSTRRRP